MFGTPITPLVRLSDDDSWQEGTDGASGIIELKEEDPGYADILLRYLYAHDTELTTTGPTLNGSCTIIRHCR